MGKIECKIRASSADQFQRKVFIAYYDIVRLSLFLLSPALEFKGASRYGADLLSMPQYLLVFNYGAFNTIG